MLTGISLLAGTLLFVPISLLGISFDSPFALLADQFATLIAITTATYMARRLLDKRPFVSLGLQPGRQAVISILAGIVIAALQMGLIFALELGLGWTSVEGFAWQFDPAPAILGGLGLWLVVFLIVGWQEELLSRGYHLQTLESGLNLFWAVLISSSVFGLLHMFNPGATLVSTIGLLLAGLFLALPYILTRQLWLSIGLHIGWNFFEGVVFGFPVSGLSTYHLLRQTASGPEIWTGGVFGPEAGLIVIPALMLGSILVILYTRSWSRRMGVLP